MKKSSACAALTFEQYDYARLNIVAAVLPVIVADALESGRDARCDPKDVRDQCALEALLMAEAMMTTLYGDRLEVRLDEHVDLNAEAKGR